MDMIFGDANPVIACAAIGIVAVFGYLVAHAFTVR